MSYAQDNGYTPDDFDTIMGEIRLGVNEQFGTTYTEGTFIGTGWYRFFYPLVQKVQEGEIKTSEIFLKLQEYISQTNQRIQRPSVSHPGLVESFESNGYTASVKAPAQADAGEISICIDTDNAAPDYATTRLAICNLIKDFVVAGMVTNGTESEDITLSNGQDFTFSFYLPNYTEIILRLTITTSDNTLLTIPSDEDIRQIVFDNIAARYRLGWDFEPERYFDFSDAPYAATILLEWSDDDGSNWYSTVSENDFQDLFTFGLEDIQVLIDP